MRISTCGSGVPCRLAPCVTVIIVPSIDFFVMSFMPSLDAMCVPAPPCCSAARLDAACLTDVDHHDVRRGFLAGLFRLPLRIDRVVQTRPAPVPVRVANEDIVKLLDPRVPDGFVAVKSGAHVQHALRRMCLPR